MGYTAVKTGPVPYTHYDFDLAEVMHTGKLLEGLREAAGDKMDILLDFHGRPSSARAALAFIDACAPARPMFVEEPIQPGDHRRHGEDRRSRGMSDRHRRTAGHASRVSRSSAICTP